jgi:para-aminobenzoate synthetase/4-amino-4-deoxychorismate lyase
MPDSRRVPVPAEIYVLVDQEPGTVLLEGGIRATQDEHEEPWTRLFTAPLQICTAFHSGEVPSLFREIERALSAGYCAAGFFSYECGAAFEATAGMRPPRTGFPLAWFGIYEHQQIFKHGSGKFDPPVPARNLSWPARDEKHASDIPAEFALDEPEHVLRIQAIHEWILSGDIYQLNFTAPLRFQIQERPAALYAHLRQRQPARYGAFLHWQEGHRILSFSPELFFRVDSNGARRITTRPMKGTAPRGRTTAEDRAVADWLCNDAKNRSENLMIVDLLRNDVGRIAQFGTVRAEKLFTVERLPTLWQMTSTVTAELRDRVRFEEVFRALFPCGSITGAPKIRAMQLIGQIEDEPRGVYTGAIGFFSPQQTIFNVAIRTIDIDGDRGEMGVGSGIVIDSRPGDEYRECRLKAEFLTRPDDKWPGEFSLIETMLWDGSFRLFDLHLDRLSDSADYFDFPCDRELVRQALEHHANEFSSKGARRVRLLLSADGQYSIKAQALPERGGPDDPVRVCISRERTDPGDRMLYHKTTHRPLYNAAFEAAHRDGYADVLFFNTRGELTEGSISTVFVEKEGRWLTPPIHCGLLPGVFRRHLLETQPHIEEVTIFEGDLRAADAVYIGNALRGLRRVIVDWPREFVTLSSTGA